MEIKLNNIDKDGEKIDFSNLVVTNFNPRFHLISDINASLIDMFRNDTTSQINQREVILRLLANEGNFDEMKDLLRSIERDGFNNKTEPILLVKNKENKYIIAEGNRRVSILKLINDDSNKIPKFININFNNYEDNVKNLVFESNEDFDNINCNINNKSKNFEECIEIIKKLKSNKNFEVYYKIVNNDEELWKLIYDKHLVGLRPGMRKWSRSKYFADLIKWMDIFSEIESKKEKEIFLHKLSNKINRNIRKIINDYKEAQLIYSYIYFCDNYYIDDDPSLTKTVFCPTNNIKIEILEKMISLENPSALEKTHSYNKVRDWLCNRDILNITKNEFNEKYHCIKYGDSESRNNDENEWLHQNHKIKIFDKKIKTNKLFPFIYEQWKNNIITTRGIKEKDREYFKTELLKLVGLLNEPKYINDEEIDLINPFVFTIENLEKFIQMNRYDHCEKIKLFENVLEIKRDNNIFINLLKEKFPEFKDLIEPKSTFTILWKQFLYVSEKNYLNAMASTLRCLIEQLVIWFTYFIKEDVDKEEHIKNISEGNISETFRKIGQDFSNKNGKLNEFIENSFNCTGEELEEINSFFNWLLINNNGNNKTIYGEILNNFIHASHRIYLDMEFNEKLKKLDKIIKNMTFIIDKINEERLNEINEKIINYLKNKQVN